MQKIKLSSLFVSEFFDMQPLVKSYAYREEDKDVIDVDGSVEIRPGMLNKGSLPFKLGKVSGDLLCYCRNFNASVVPESLDGEIIFLNPCLGDIYLKHRFKIDDEVYYIENGKIFHKEVKGILISSEYNADKRIRTEIVYYLGFSKRRVNEQHAFSSIEDLQKRILSYDRSVMDSSPCTSISLRYKLGDEVWFWKGECPTCGLISGIIIVRGEVPDHKAGLMYEISQGNEKFSLLEMQLWDSKCALVSDI